jgi:hypothetical protein
MIYGAPLGGHNTEFSDSFGESWSRTVKKTPCKDRHRARPDRFSFVAEIFFFLICLKWGVESKLGPLGTAIIYCLIVPAPGDCGDGELFGGMKIGRGNRSTRRKPAPALLCPP